MSGLSGVCEVFMARVVAGGKITIPLLVRDVMKIEEGDYVRVSVSEVIKKQSERLRRKSLG